MTDEKIISAPVRAGDCSLPLSESACSLLVREHGPMVKAACQRIVRDPSLAEDLTQEVFLLFVRKLSTLRPETKLAGWLYVTACNLARTHQRGAARRAQREQLAHSPHTFMNATDHANWRELEPLLDDAMLTLTERQRELVLCRYFQNQTQRSAAELVCCSESVASRELSTAIERLAKFFERRGVTISGAVLAGLLTKHAAEAAVTNGSLVSTLASASALAASIAPATLFFTLMSTTTKILLFGAAALLVGTGTIYYLREPANPSPLHPEIGQQDKANAESAMPASVASKPIAQTTNQQRARSTTESLKGATKFDEATLEEARERQEKFFKRVSELAIMTDPSKVQELLAREYGIVMPVEEIVEMQKMGPKGFTFNLIRRWANRQPQEALTWAAGSLDPRDNTGVSFQQIFLDAAREALPDLTHDALAAMLPDAPGAQNLLDLFDAATNPSVLGQRILGLTDPAERMLEIKTLAKGWRDKEAAAQWGRANLAGEERAEFYAHVGYDLAEGRPEAALAMLAELKDTDGFARAFSSMMRGLVQTGGLGQQAADLIQSSTLKPDQRAELISELSRRWVRNDPDATVAWANTLTSPEDIRAAIPLLVSQLDNDRVARTVDAYLKNPNANLELALVEAAAPSSIRFDPDKARLILDPLLARDPNFKLVATPANGTDRASMYWNSVNSAARLETEGGSPTVAMDWLAKLPFATENDYAKAVGNVFTTWNSKAPQEAIAWLETSKLNPQLRASLEKSLAQP